VDVYARCVEIYFFPYDTFLYTFRGAAGGLGWTAVDSSEQNFQEIRGELATVDIGGRQALESISRSTGLTLSEGSGYSRKLLRLHKLRVVGRCPASC
jgi:hypothetical protein